MNGEGCGVVEVEAVGGQGFVPGGAQSGCLIECGSGAVGGFCADADSFGAAVGYDEGDFAFFVGILLQGVELDESGIGP